MENEVYITGVVIPNGIADHEGDLLNKKDILKIFTKYLDRATDTMHTRIRNKGVDVLANWISETDHEIGGQNVPAGSWLSTLRVTNPEIIKSIQDGDITGLSLGSIPEYALKQEHWFINKSMNYADLDDMEEVIPLYISFVDKPSNGFGFEVVDYNTYINKNRSDDKMVEQTEINKDENVSLSVLEKVAEIFSINKSADEEPVKDEEPTKEEDDDISNKELLEKIPAAVENGIVSAFEKMQETTEPVVEKKEEEPEPVKEDEPEKEDEPKIDKSEKEEPEINKRQTEKTENVEVPNVNTNFYKKSGRDMFGCRIK